MKEFSDQSCTEETHIGDPTELKKKGAHLNEDAAAYYQQVALNMRIARRKMNITQQQIADSMGIPRSTYKSLESGKTGIYCYHMAKWSSITGYDLRVLTRGTAYDLTLNIENYELLELAQDLNKEQYQAVLALIKAF